MSRLCTWFDAYRDGELSAAQQEQFKAHLSTCEECSQKTLLLNNFVRVLNTPLPAPPVFLPEQIARRVFQQSESWDVWLHSWFRPAIAWSAVALALMVSTLLWILPGAQQTNTYNDYEMLMLGSEPSVSSAPAENQTDEELMSWLELGGYFR